MVRDCFSFREFILDTISPLNWINNYKQKTDSPMVSFIELCYWGNKSKKKTSIFFKISFNSVMFAIITRIWIYYCANVLIQSIVILSLSNRKLF